MVVKVIQFLRPNGKQREQETDLPDSLKSAYQQMLSNGRRFTAEMLTTGEISVCIEDPEKGDLFCEVIPNGPEVQAAMAKMLAEYGQQLDAPSPSR